MTLYERLGGERALEAAVDVFYARVLDDDRLADFFDGTDMLRLKAHQRAFLSLALGGPNAYCDCSMQAVHTRPVRLGLDDDHYGAVLENLCLALIALGLQPALIAEAAEQADRARDAMLGHLPPPSTTCVRHGRDERQDWQSVKRQTSGCLQNRLNETS